MFPSEKRMKRMHVLKSNSEECLEISRQNCSRVVHKLVQSERHVRPPA